MGKTRKGGREIEGSNISWWQGDKNPPSYLQNSKTNVTLGK